MQINNFDDLNNLVRRILHINNINDKQIIEVNISVDNDVYQEILSGVEKENYFQIILGVTNQEYAERNRFSVLLSGIRFNISREFVRI